MRRVRDLVLGFALVRGVADAVRREGEDAARRRRRRPPDRDQRLVALMLGAFALGAPLIVLFESTVLRVGGALLLCVFIVAGVFVVADPAFLEPDDEGG